MEDEDALETAVAIMRWYLNPGYTPAPSQRPEGLASIPGEGLSLPFWPRKCIREKNQMHLTKGNESF